MRDEYLRQLILSNVSRETFDMLETYVEILIYWNKKINLISRCTNKDEIFNDHILDSLILTRYIRNKEAVIVDVGSGAGLPGMVVAIAGFNNCYLVEANAKKAAFLVEVCSKLKIKATVLNAYVEKIENIQADYIISRAVTSVADLINISKKITKSDSIFLLHKSEKQHKEVDELRAEWDFNLQRLPNDYKENNIIISIANLSKINDVV